MAGANGSRTSDGPLIHLGQDLLRYKGVRGTLGGTRTSTSCCDIPRSALTEATGLPSRVLPPTSDFDHLETCRWYGPIQPLCAEEMPDDPSMGDQEMAAVFELGDELVDSPGECIDGLASRSFETVE